MNEDIDDFLSYIASERGLALNTVEAYERDVKAFSKFLKEKNIVSVQFVTTESIVSYLTQLTKELYATASIYRSLMAIKMFFRFLLREGKIGVNQALYLQSPKLWQLIPSVLTHEEVEALLKMPDLSTEYGLRDKALLEVLYASGLRVSELCALDIYSVDEQSVRVIGKGQKTRIVPIGEVALEAIDAYLLRYRGHYDSEKQLALFVNKKGIRL